VKSEEWPRVKPGDRFIRADVYEGPRLVRISRINLQIYTKSTDPKIPSGWTYPYGLTSTTGTVEIRENEATHIVNLRDLIPYSPAVYDALTRIWTRFQNTLTAHNAVKTELINKIQELV